MASSTAIDFLVGKGWTKEQAAGIKSVIALILVCIGIFVVNYKKEVTKED